MMKVNYKSLQIKPSNNLSISTNTPSLPFLSIMMGNNISLTLLVVYINGVSEINYVFTSNSYYRRSEYKLSSCLGYTILVEALEMLIERDIDDTSTSQFPFEDCWRRLNKN